MILIALSLGLKKILLVYFTTPEIPLIKAFRNGGHENICTVLRLLISFTVAL